MVTTTRAVFDKQLADLRKKVSTLSEMVIQQAVDAIEALQTRNIPLAHQVDQSDKDVNQLRYTIEEECYALLALQQPNSHDMRLIVAVVSIATNLERMGDHAAGIGRLVLRMEGKPCWIAVPELDKMAQLAIENLREALIAFGNEDEPLARAIVAKDSEIDFLHRQVYGRMVDQMMSDKTAIECATMLLWVSHNLERYADRTSNICERIVYLVTGELWEYHVEPNIPSR